MGAGVGLSVGVLVGLFVGSLVGVEVGLSVGSLVGVEVGSAVVGVGDGSGVRLHRSGLQKGPHSLLGYSFETNRQESSSDRLPPHWLILYSILSPQG